MNLPQLQQASTEDTGIDRKIVILGTSVLHNRKVLRELTAAGIDCHAIEDVITSVRTLGDSFFEDRNLVFVEVTTYDQDVRLGDLRAPFEYVTQMRFVADMSTRFGFAAYLYTQNGTVVEMVEAFRKFLSQESLFETQKYELLSARLSISNLEARETELEAQFSSVRASLVEEISRCKALEETNRGLSSRVTALETSNGALQSEVEAANAAVEAANAAIEAAKTRADAAESQVDTLSKQVVDLEAQVAELQAQLDAKPAP